MPQVFEVQINPTQHLHASDVLLNNQPLHITWTTSDYNSSWTVISPSTQSLTIPDKLGFPHDVRVSLAGTVADVPESSHISFKNPQTQNINVHIDSVDDLRSGSSGLVGFTLLTDPTAPPRRRLLWLVPNHVPDTIKFDQYEESFMVAQPVDDNASFTQPERYEDDENYGIDAEIESLLLLEAQAGELHTAIAAKKHAIAKCLKDHRDHVTLKHLLNQCDGLVCAAKVIAQRICDKMGILTVPKVGYAQVQDPHLQHLIDLDDENGRPVNPSFGSEKYSNATRMGSLSSAAIQPIQVVYPQSLLFRVLGGIAAALGLTALFAFIRRKCMSARRRVERAADQEERRNARAYRRAARRAEIRRRWDAFIASINCFRAAPGPTRIEDYEEKRALILQDAFLEQEIDAAEKGEVMEAEIRELRHAHEIVSSLVRVDEHRYDLITPLNDPPPPLVPLAYTPATRSRASTATLPSYTSEPLPDYSSRYTRTTAGSISSSSSLRSNSFVGVRSPITSSSEGGAFTGSTPRTHSVDSSSNGSRRSRYTPTSSVIETSPRASEETLRTNCRRSRDTNDL